MDVGRISRTSSRVGCALVAALVACRAGSREEQAAPTPAAPAPLVRVAQAEPLAPEEPAEFATTSAGGTWRVRWRPVPAPIRENEPFEMEVELEPAPGAAASSDPRLEVEAWMPAHRHGMIRQPVTDALGGGRYRVRGMLLHMGGDWRLTLALGSGGKFEAAVFELALLPAETARTLAGFEPAEVARVLAHSPLPPPPDDPTNAHDGDEAAAHFGRWLFFDPRLSGSGNVSCATCHDPERDWADGKELADAGTRIERHTLSLWNVAYGRWFFWDGRADSLWAQALKPLEDPREHASDRVSLARLVAGDEALRRGYEEAFGALPAALDVARLPERARPLLDAPDDPLARAWDALDARQRDAVDEVFSDLGKALAAFERRIVSRDSAFDRFVAALVDGDSAGVESYPPDALRGLSLFVGEARCHVCHSGPNFSDREFHATRLPVSAELPTDLGRFKGRMAVRADPFNGLGRFADGADADTRAKLEHTPPTGHVWGEFKTPTLRNAARTAPYMHQGQLATLRAVIEFYSDEVPPPHPQEGERVLAPLFLDEGEKRDLEAFLGTLVDTRIADELRAPPPRPYR